MRTFRIVLGACLLLAVSVVTLGGVWMLRQAGGGGLHVRVTFSDTKNLSADDDVIYGDGIVGRIESIDGDTVTVRIASEYSGLVHEGSRFWIQSSPGMGVLMFDTPLESGSAVKPGHEFKGLPERPEPDPKLAPPPVARKLTDRPPWLCELRATLELSDEWTVTQRRKTAAVITSVREGGDLVILAPSWAVEYSGKLADERYRIELVGGETWSAEILATRLPWVVLIARGTGYTGPAAPFWPDELGEGQGLVLTDFEGSAYTVMHADGDVELQAATEGGMLALIEGFNVAGFTLPAVASETGVRWQPLNGAGDAINEAKAKLK